MPSQPPSMIVSLYLRLIGFITLMLALLMLAPALSAAIPAAVEAAEQAYQRDPTWENQQRRDALVARYVFQVEEVDSEPDADPARLCVHFNQTLLGSTLLDYSAYLQISPAVDGGIQITGRTLCIAGVEHGEEYRIQVQAGLPAANGLELHTELDRTLRIVDRSQRVAFRGQAFILPMAGEQSVPLSTVNVQRIELQLLQLAERNLVHILRDYEFSDALDDWEQQRLAQRYGTVLHEQRLSIDAPTNREVTTALALQPLLGQREPGLYLLTAAAVDEDGQIEAWQRAGQWLVVSDIGLFTLRGEDGLHVFCRSLATGQPRAAALQLFARNNMLLAESRCDRSGYAQFAPGLLRGEGSRRAMLLVAAAENDFNLLDLRSTGFDLTDRGVSGRSAPGVMDLSLYTERGIYRPGETVELLALLRDDRANALSGLPLTLIVRRPDGSLADERRVLDERAGGYHTQIHLPDNARTGTWQVQAHVGDQQIIGSRYFQVEDFVPPRLSLALSSHAQDLTPQQPFTLRLDGEFLYGAPAAGASAEVELFLRPAATPFAAYADYHFGLVDDDYPIARLEQHALRLDSEGIAHLELQLDAVPDTTQPLELLARGRILEPGGRPASAQWQAPYHHRGHAIGVRPDFTGGRVSQGARPQFQIVLLDQHGQPQSQGRLNYRLIREQYRPLWSLDNDRWRYEPQWIDQPTPIGGVLQLTTREPLPLALDALDWGRYRLEFSDAQTRSASSLRFDVGWGGSATGPERPDQLLLRLNEPSYRPGDVAIAHIEADFNGPVLVTVVNNRLVWRTEVELNPLTRQVEVAIPVEAGWAPGAYVTATAFRPAQHSTRRGPARAIGVAHLPVQQPERVMSVELLAAETIRPRSTAEVTVRLAEPRPHQPIWLTLAAVDEGVLQLTDFRSPQPVEDFLGQRRLAMTLDDHYGRLIQPGSQAATARVGGDGDIRHGDGLAVRPQRVLTLYSGIQAVPASGVLTVPLTIPDFTGRVRLMATVWSEQALGQAEGAMRVVDPLLAELYLPRFLAPADQALVRLQIAPVAAPPGEYRLQLRAEGAVAVDTLDTRLTVAATGDALIFDEWLPVQAVAAGRGDVYVSISHAQTGVLVERQWSLSVREPALSVMSRRAGRLQAGQRLALDSAVYAPLPTRDTQVTLHFSSRSPLDPQPLIHGLTHYPYTCAEQTASRLWGLLAAPDSDATAISAVLNQLLNLQTRNGDFRLWPHSAVDEWVSAYVTDVLFTAQAQGYPLAPSVWARSLEGVANQVSRWEGGVDTSAYALYVLARAGRPAYADSRYLFDEYADQLNQPLTLAFLGSALALANQAERAEQAFTRVLTLLQGADTGWAVAPYGSRLRDRAAVLALALEAGYTTPPWLAQLDTVLAILNQRQGLSTQEQAWLLRLSEQLATAGTQVRARFANGERVDSVSDYRLNLDAGALLALGSVSADEALWYSVVAQGRLPITQALTTPGVNVQRRWLTLDGEPADPDAVALGERRVVVIEGRVPRSEWRDVLLVDLLPAGMEIENPRIDDDPTLEALGQRLGERTAVEHIEYRDDRLLAAFNAQYLGESGDFRLAYVVRAVTGGRFVAPGVYLEDMYRPWLQASERGGALLITPPRVMP